LYLFFVSLEKVCKKRRESFYLHYRQFVPGAVEPQEVVDVNDRDPRVQRAGGDRTNEVSKGCKHQRAEQIDPPQAHD